MKIKTGLAVGINPIIPDNHRIVEIVAVLLTAVGKFIFMDILQWKLPFILSIIGGWTIYVVYRCRSTPGILPYWGFRRDTFKEVARKVLPFAVTAIVLCFLIGYYRGTLNLTWHIFPILLLYPIWGCIQQFLVIALVAGNLQDLKNYSVNHATAIVTAALLFGLMHYPYYWLMIGTTVLALLYGFIYLRNRNIYVMGIFHGWLGALFFYTVVGRDPFAEIFGKLTQP
jgi:membrane protease YdiL (CAAX protease family)